MDDLKVVKCCVCLRPKWREVDPIHKPGMYDRVRGVGWCPARKETDDCDKMGRSV